MSGIFGYEEVRQARLSFSLPAGDVQVTAVPEGGGPGFARRLDGDLLPLTGAPALYRVTATLEGVAGDYTAEFRFAVGDVD